MRFILLRLSFFHLRTFVDEDAVTDRCSFHSTMFG